MINLISRDYINSSTNNTNQNKSSGIPGYNTAQIINIGTENGISEPVKISKMT